jgi:hypothetical protein
MVADSCSTCPLEERILHSNVRPASTAELDKAAVSIGIQSPTVREGVYDPVVTAFDSSGREAVSRVRAANEEYGDVEDGRVRRSTRSSNEILSAEQVV